MISENLKAKNLNLPKNSNNSLIKKRLLMDQEYDIFYIVKRLGAPLTQAFGALIGKFFKPAFSSVKFQKAIK
jgi:hypothetical protein